MRTLKLQVQISIDGYIAGPKGEMDWLEWNWDNELKQFVKDLTAPVDCIVLGRKLAEGFIPYWARIAANPQDPEFEAGKKINETAKIVFTKTLEQSQWENTRLAKGNLADEINALKNQEGKDMIVYGGADFVSHLIEQNLIDELYLFVSPTAMGNGMKIFNGKTIFSLLKSISFACGITVLKYQPSKK